MVRLIKEQVNCKSSYYKNVSTDPLGNGREHTLGTTALLYSQDPATGPHTDLNHLKPFRNLTFRRRNFLLNFSTPVYKM